MALHPQFTRSNYKQFVTGGKKVSVCPAFYLCVRSSVIHPDCVPVKPNLAHLPSLAGLKARRGTLFGVKGSWFPVSLLECSRESWPLSQSAVLSTASQRQCFASAASRCHYRARVGISASSDVYPELCPREVFLPPQSKTYPCKFVTLWILLRVNQIFFTGNQLLYATKNGLCK